MFKWPWHAQVETSVAALPWQQALAQPIFSLLDENEQTSLIALAQRFLQQKKITPLQALQLDELRTARLALLFCLPVLKLGLEWLDGFHEILIYPEPFNVDDHWQDDSGLVHQAAAVHAGQSWTQGPVVLNALDIQDSFDLSGYNLVIHEVAHKLDARGSGYTSGVPAIALRDVASWEKDLLQAMEEIEAEVELVGEQAATIDPYAASDPAECFAVLSEYFFSAPDLLAERFPAMYRHLQQFYRQDPLARLAATRPEIA
ncbi:DgsA anti-repressor MtfA [Pantoea phytobeneficialis]|uniref:Mlc titration factor A n=1 Tax=Pantoea phytobeneficialis TaxID=2052056 RepID=A0AAP9KQE4_9GAMM|nr:DgsA anti-repressor MtfA [Pantoea phytobeneficialis]MDO6408833.1 DgsA anti-repressor MtfA [Pantoea phytobeneficialis]QGR07946.1 DgsA anti-repressor MtfA [Pantoea phytobeneficialis]